MLANFHGVLRIFSWSSAWRGSREDLRGIMRDWCAENQSSTAYLQLLRDRNITRYMQWLHFAEAAEFQIRTAESPCGNMGLSSSGCSGIPQQAHY